MTSGGGGIGNKLDDRLLIMQDMINDKRQAFDQKVKKYDSKLEKQDSKLDKLTEMVKKKMDQNKNSNSFPDKIDKPKAQDPKILVLNNKKAPPLECIHCIKNGGMWTLKHEIS